MSYFDDFKDENSWNYIRRQAGIDNDSEFVLAVSNHLPSFFFFKEYYSNWEIGYYYRCVLENQVSKEMVNAIIRGLDYHLFCFNVPIEERIVFYKLLIWKQNGN